MALAVQLINHRQVLLRGLMLGLVLGPVLGPVLGLACLSKLPKLPK
jgi:hypothetical protein